MTLSPSLIALLLVTCECEVSVLCGALMHVVRKKLETANCNCGEQIEKTIIQYSSPYNALLNIESLLAYKRYLVVT